MKSGANTSSVESSPENSRRRAAARRREEARWARKSGPVREYRVCPECGGSGLYADTFDPGELTAYEIECLDSTRCRRCFGDGRVNA